MFNHSTPMHSRWSQFLLVGTALLMLLFSWPVFTHLAQVYSIEDDYSHGFMIPFVSGYTGWQIWKFSKTKLVFPTWLGIPILSLGVGMIIFGHWYYIALFPSGLGVAFIYASGLILCLAGGIASLAGIPALRLFSFPIAYMVFAIPFPKSLTLPLTLELRNWVSILSEHAIRMFGITIFREGNVLHLAQTSLGVEDACSGIRSFWILMAGAAALGYILKIGIQKNLFLCIGTIPIAIVMNVFRVLITAILVSSYGPHFAKGWRHDLWGGLTFILGLGFVILLAFIFSKGWPKNFLVNKEKQDAPLRLTFISSPNVKRTVIGLFMGLVFGLGASANYVIRNHYDFIDIHSFQNRKNFHEIPDQFGTYKKIDQGEILQEHLELLNPIDHLIRYYKDEKNRKIEVRMLYWSPLKFRRGESWQGVGSHIPDICFPSWGFERLVDQDASPTLDGAYKNCHLRIFRKNAREYCVLYWYKGKHSENLFRSGYLGDRIRALIASWKNPVLHHGVQYIITVISEVLDSREEAKRNVREFSNLLSPLLSEFGIENESEK